MKSAWLALSCPAGFAVLAEQFRHMYWLDSPQAGMRLNQVWSGVVRCPRMSSAMQKFCLNWTCWRGFIFEFQVGNIAAALAAGRYLTPSLSAFVEIMLFHICGFQSLCSWEGRPHEASAIWICVRLTHFCHTCLLYKHAPLQIFLLSLLGPCFFGLALENRFHFFCNVLSGTNVKRCQQTLPFSKNGFVPKRCAYDFPLWLQRLCWECLGKCRAQRGNAEFIGNGDATRLMSQREEGKPVPPWKLSVRSPFLSCPASSLHIESGHYWCGGFGFLISKTFFSLPYQRGYRAAANYVLNIDKSSLASRQKDSPVMFHWLPPLEFGCGINKVVGRLFIASRCWFPCQACFWCSAANSLSKPAW